MTSVCQMPEKDVILKLLEVPIPDSELFQMSSTELQGLSFGIDRLAVVFRGEPQLLSGLRELNSRVKSAENYLFQFRLKFNFYTLTYSCELIYSRYFQLKI